MVDLFDTRSVLIACHVSSIRHMVGCSSIHHRPSHHYSHLPYYLHLSCSFLALGFAFALLFFFAGLATVYTYSYLYKIDGDVIQSQ